MITFHPLKKEDLKFLVDLFNEQYTWDPITESILNEKIFHEEFYDSDLNCIVKYHNRLAGFASSLIRKEAGETIGWIKLLATIDQQDSGRIIRTTFKKIERALKEKGASIIRFFDSFPNYFTPGIDPHYTALIALLEELGYKKRRDNVTMLVNLQTQSFNTTKKENSLAKGITVKRAAETDKQKMMAFIDREFAIWKPEIKIAFEKDRPPLHIALKNNQIIAFANHSCNNIGTAWFGPMGTTKAARGKGLGEILLNRCLNDLKEAEFDQAIIPWVGPIGFYFNKCHAKVHRVYWNYVKTLRK